MANRLPLVIIDGKWSQLPSGDVLNAIVRIAETSSYSLNAGVGGGTTLFTGSIYYITASQAISASWAPSAGVGGGTTLFTGSIYYITASSAGTASTIVGQNTNTIWIPAVAMVPNISSGSSIGTLEFGPERTMISYQNFGKLIPQTAQFAISMPKSWDVGTISAQFIFTTAYTGSAATGSVVWSLGGGSAGANDNLNLTFGTTQSIVATTETGNLYTSSYFHYTSSRLSALTIGGSPQPEDTVWFKVYRNPRISTDTLSGSAALIGVKLLIGTTKVNDE